MGFETRRPIRLEFEGDDGESAYVRLTAPTYGEIDILTGDDREAAMDQMATHLLDWDLELDGAPLPATAEGLRLLEPSLAWLIWTEWLKAAKEVPAPLARRSNGGAPSAPPLLTMEAL